MYSLRSIPLIAVRSTFASTAKFSCVIFLEIDIEDLHSEKIIAFSRQNLCYSERYFSEMFETHGLTGNIAYRSHEE